MNGSTAVGGIDPGPRPGLVILHVDGGRLVRVERGAHLTWQRVVASSALVAVERYVRGPGSVRRANSGAQLETERMAQEACLLARESRRALQALPAGSVKPWADDERLRAYVVGSQANGTAEARASLYEMTRGGGGHDRDAARHALMFAVKRGLLPKL